MEGEIGKKNKEVKSSSFKVSQRDAMYSTGDTVKRL